MLVVRIGAPQKPNLTDEPEAYWRTFTFNGSRWENESGHHRFDARVTRGAILSLPDKECPTLSRP
jgi:hypothetical protein